jgi:hypothetical protein
LGPQTFWSDDDSVMWCVLRYSLLIAFSQLFDHQRVIFNFFEESRRIEVVNSAECSKLKSFYLMLSDTGRETRSSGGCMIQNYDLEVHEFRTDVQRSRGWGVRYTIFELLIQFVLVSGPTHKSHILKAETKTAASTKKRWKTRICERRFLLAPVDMIGSSFQMQTFEKEFVKWPVRYVWYVLFPLQYSIVNCVVKSDFHFSPFFTTRTYVTRCTLVSVSPVSEVGVVLRHLWECENELMSDVRVDFDFDIGNGC